MWVNRRKKVCRDTAASQKSIFYYTLRAGTPRSPAGPLRLSLLRRRDGLVQVPKNIAQVFDPHRHANQVLGDARLELIGVGELLVRSRSRVDDQALGIPQVRQVREKLHRVDQLAPGLQSALDAERHDGAASPRQILLRQRFVRTRGQSGILHPVDSGML